jgi:hypothetical protein
LQVKGELKTNVIFGALAGRLAPIAKKTNRQYVESL